MLVLTVRNSRNRPIITEAKLCSFACFKIYPSHVHATFKFLLLALELIQKALSALVVEKNRRIVVRAHLKMRIQVCASYTHSFIMFVSISNSLNDRTRSLVLEEVECTLYFLDLQ